MLRLILLFLALPALADVPNPFFAMDTCTAKRYGHPEMSVEGQLDLVKSLGYAGLAWTQDSARETLAAVEAAEARGLRVYAVYFNAQLTKEKLSFSPVVRETVAALKGHPDVIAWVHVTSKDFASSSPEGDEIAVAGFRDLADFAAGNGVRVAIYPHVGNWTERVQDAVRVAKKVGRKNLGVTFNFCHCLKVGDEAKIPELLSDAAPHLFVVTINGADANAAADKDWKRIIQPLDQGTYDVSIVLRRLRELGYTGPIGLQGYGIKSEVRTTLEHSMRGWRAIVERVSP